MTYRWKTNASVLLISITAGAALLTACDRETNSPPPSASAPAPVPAPVHEHPAATSSPADTATDHSQHETSEPVLLTHVHGLAYTPDGKQIMIPSHHGLAVFDGTRWSKAAGPAHDYMGFAVTNDAIYSSGHPAPGSGLVNPFGVIKSKDGGQTWQNLGMEGESDFHLLAASHGTNALYVVNPAPNSRMSEAGLYFTLNDGFNWERAAAKGLNSEPISLAVHPSAPKTVALGTENGLLLSQDGGNSFDRVASQPTVATYFDLDGKHIWIGIAGDTSELARLNLDSKEVTKVAFPKLEKDAVAYIAQNPAKRSEYAAATFKRDVYVSQDQGKNWKQIADDGKTL